MHRSEAMFRSGLLGIPGEGTKPSLLNQDFGVLPFHRLKPLHSLSVHVSPFSLETAPLFLYCDSSSSEAGSGRAASGFYELGAFGR
jgi:hypothetical protein